MFCLIVCCLLVQGDQISARQFRRMVRDTLDDPQLADGVWGLVVDAPLRGQRLISIHPETNFRPASNMKILTTYSAFRALGCDYVYTTDFGWCGAIQDEVLRGWLVVGAYGDPSLGGERNGQLSSHAIFQQVANALRTQGIKHIERGIQIYQPVFDKEYVDGTWEVGDLGTYYGSTVTDLSTNDSWSTVVLRMGSAGNVSYEFEPPTVQTIVRLQVGVGEQEQLSTSRTPDGTFTINGEMTVCSQARVRMSVARPDLTFAESLARYLETIGIRVGGSIQLTDQWPAGTYPLISIPSLTLSDLAEVLMKESQNRYADCFAKTVAFHQRGVGSFDEFADVLQMQLAADGISTAGLSVRDGSGLSAQNYVRPEILLGVLNSQLEHVDAARWLTTFPVMGVDGTLERRGDDRTVGRVWAKTGYIYRSRTLSGYVETFDGEPLVFSIMVNNYGASTTVINHVQDDLVALMVRLKAPRRVRNAPNRYVLSRLAVPSP